MVVSSIQILQIRAPLLTSAFWGLSLFHAQPPMPPPSRAHLVIAQKVRQIYVVVHVSQRLFPVVLIPRSSPLGLSLP